MDYSRESSKIAYVDAGGRLCIRHSNGTSEQLVANFGDIRYPQWSADGQKIVFMSNGPGNTGEYYCYTVDLTGGMPQQVVQGNNPDLSADGTKLAYINTADGSKLYVADADGSNPTKITDFMPGHFSWSSTGKFVFGSDGSTDGTFVCNSDGSGLKKISSLMAGDPNWSPDGKKIAFVSDGSVYVMNTDGTGTKKLATGSAATTRSPHWTSDGKSLVFGMNDDIYSVNIDGTGLKDITNTPGVEESPAVWGTFGNFVQAPDIDSRLIGGAGVDVLQGGAGNDTIIGGAGNDTLYGGDGSGNDILDGGLGNDALEGGLGMDTYKFGVGSGRDTIVRGSSNAEDTIQFGAGVTLAGLSVSTNNTDLVFTLNSKDSLTVENGVAGVDIGKIAFADKTTYALKAGSNNDDNVFSVTDGNSVLYGLGGNDEITGGAGNDVLYGGDGDDTLDGGVGSDKVFGGAGNDVYIYDKGDLAANVSGGADNDTVDASAYDGNLAINLTTVYKDFENVIGGTGSDTFIGTGGANLLDGRGGNDILLGGAGDDTLLGGDGDDILDGGVGNDVLGGGTGHDTYKFGVGSGHDRIVGDSGNNEDTIMFGPGATLGNLSVTALDSGDLVLFVNSKDSLMIEGGTTAKVGKIYFAADKSSYDFQVGTNNDEALDLSGASNAVAIYGLDGDDKLSGGSANDYVYGGVGNDTLIGGLGNDTLEGGDGNDKLIGDAGNDVLYANGGDDILDGGAGSDKIFGGAGNDTYIYDKNDLVANVSGGADIDTVDASGSSDNLSINLAKVYKDFENIAGGSGSDTLTGNAGANILEGRSGNDVLNGGAGNDTLDGGDGSDILDGGAGNDILTGGTGNDTYKFNIGSGRDTITADASNVNDTIIFGAGISMTNLVFTRDGDNLLINIKGNSVDSLKIEGWYTGNQVGTFSFADGSRESFQNLQLIYGSNTNIGTEVVNGTDGNDRILGLGGDDILTGGKGDDILSGGAGNDIYYFGRGFGNDTITRETTNKYDVIQFGDGIGMEEDTRLEFEKNGNDLIIRVQYAPVEGQDPLPDDTLTLTGWYNSGDSKITRVRLGQGDETVDYTMNNVIVGNSGNNVLQGTGLNDVIQGKDGNDIIYGGAGSDMLEGNSGNDTIYGGAGDDRLEGNDGDDILYGDAGNDILYDRSGNNTMYGGAGNDELTINGFFDRPGEGYVNKLYGGDGNDHLRAWGNDQNILDGGAGNDLIESRSRGDSILRGGAGDDSYIIGDFGNTIIEDSLGVNTVRIRGMADDGSDGADYASTNYTYEFDGADLVMVNKTTGAEIRFANWVAGGQSQVATVQFSDGTLTNTQMTELAGGMAGPVIGSGKIVGTADNESLVGGSGNDILNGNGGNDFLSGGAGADTYVFDLGLDSQNITVASDKTNYLDTLKIVVPSDIFTKIGDGENSPVERRGDDLVLTFNENHSITLKNWWAADPATRLSKINISLGSQDSDSPLANFNLSFKLMVGSDGVATLNGGADGELIAGFGKTHVLNGNGGNDFIIGAEGNDTLSGGDGIDILMGGGGDDRLLGGSGSDLLVSSSGKDIMSGGAGADIYYFDLGEGFSGGTDGWFGNTTITSDSTNISDTVQIDVASIWPSWDDVNNVLIPGLSQHERIDISREGNNLVLSVKNGQDQGETAFLTIQDWYKGGGYQLNHFNFDGDGEYMIDSNGQWKTYTPPAPGTSPVKVATSTDAAQTWTYTPGSGSMEITANSKNYLDTLKINLDPMQALFAGDWQPTVTRSGENDENLVLAINGNNTLTIDGWYKGYDYQIHNLVLSVPGTGAFAGTNFNLAFNLIAGGGTDDLLKGNATTGKNELIVGGDGQDTLYGYGGDDLLFGGEQNDVLYGGDGADILEGGGGQDVLYGGAGKDLYIINSGSWDRTEIEPNHWLSSNNMDTIKSAAGSDNSEDKVAFGKDIDWHSLVLTADGNDLIITKRSSYEFYDGVGMSTNTIDEQLVKIEDFANHQPELYFLNDKTSHTVNWNGGTPTLLG